MPTENPTTIIIEVKFRGDGGELYTGPERRDQRRSKNGDADLCLKRILKEVRRPGLVALAEDRSFAIEFNHQPPGAEGDQGDLRRVCIDIVCRRVSASVSEAMQKVYLESLQPR